MHKLGALLVVSLLFFVVTSAWAQDGSLDERRERARPLALEGIDLLAKGEARAAIAKLEEAERLFHAPTHLLYLARALRELGELVAAHETYVQILLEEIPNYAPEPFQEAQRQATKEVEELRERVATVRVRVEGARPGEARVSIDGEEIAAERLAHPIAVTPGGHDVVAAGDGVEKSERVEATIGQTSEVVLTLVAGAPEPVTSQPPATGEGSFPALATVLAVIGGGALIAGAVTGGMTLAKASDIKDTCVEDICPLEQQGEADDAKLLGNVSTGLFVAGGVLAATAIVLFIVDPFDDGDDTDAALRLELGPGRARLHGSF
jgi:hypothetical protein